MPCYDPRDTDPELARRDGYESAKREFTHNSPVAELLCYLLTNSPAARTHAATNPALGRWWRDHQARDAKRKQKRKV
ncbi:hypothetical protein FDJ28_gp53 [Pseudomonas phage Bjorn]|uniref:Uncharacterized protein n=1 Tax=Pseudomonas phage Bjorn TaxID=2079288 RepID=A0A2K9VHL5_9CAUD|nr:hypothetical protein FDJ28_gp53 [Pseudomonas phage Bjorn]AUV61799.1 hypothetical protein PsPhBjorn_gp17 [Pseudomonas phage Bjorn]